jgi:hypothetical protein
VALEAGETYFVCALERHKVIKRIVKILVLLCALCGEWSVAAPDAEESRHRDRDGSAAKLFDAHGKFVGKVVFFNGFAEGGVILNIHGALVYAGINRIGTPAGDWSATQLEWWGAGAYFSGPNCSGTVYIAYPSEPFRPTAMVRSGATATLYVASEGPRQIVTVHSVEDRPGLCREVDPPFEVQAWTVGSTFDLTQHYLELLRVGF